MKRVEANRKIVQILAGLVENYPDWRFQQILQNIGISSSDGRDRWYEESEETLKNIENSTTV